jgi:DNA-binding transcriptional ArsR family regulator
MRKRGQLASADVGRFRYEGLDRTLHERARLGVMASLLTSAEGRLFADLKRVCGLTDGNLSRHLEVLRKTGMVEVWKGFDNRRPQTLCRLSPMGRQRFRAYVRELQRVVRDATPPRRARHGHPTTLPAGWTKEE